jgi:hypothetical protein
MFISNIPQWESYGSKRSLCELITGHYLPESDLKIETHFINNIPFLEIK